MKKVEDYVRTIPDFPEKGIMKDYSSRLTVLTTLLKMLIMMWW